MVLLLTLLGCSDLFTIHCEDGEVLPHLTRPPAGAGAELRKHLYNCLQTLLCAAHPVRLVDHQPADLLQAGLLLSRPATVTAAVSL